MLWGAPGIGGGLGKCAVCGGDFAKEILLGRGVHKFAMDGFKDDLCAHEKCMGDLEHARGNGWETLPQGPIRKAFADAATTDAKPDASDALDKAAREGL